MLLQLRYHIFMHPDNIPIPMWSIILKELTISDYHLLID